MKISFRSLILITVGALIIPAANASVIYTFTATSAECLACGNTGPEPLPSFTLVLSNLISGANAVPLISFLAANNLGASTFLLAGGSGVAGHDSVTITNSNGTYDYDFTAGTLSKIGGPTSAAVGAFDTFSQAGVITITETSTAPEPSTALLLIILTAACFLGRRRLFQRPPIFGGVGDEN